MTFTHPCSGLTSHRPSVCYKSGCNESDVENTAGQFPPPPPPSLPSVFSKLSGTPSWLVFCRTKRHPVESSLVARRHRELLTTGQLRLKPSSYTEAILRITANYRTIFYFSLLLFRKCKSVEAYLQLWNVIQLNETVGVPYSATWKLSLSLSVFFPPLFCFLSLFPLSFA